MHHWSLRIPHGHGFPLCVSRCGVKVFFPNPAIAAVGRVVDVTVDAGVKDALFADDLLCKFGGDGFHWFFLPLFDEYIITHGLYDCKGFLQKIKKIFEVASMEIKWISTPKTCKDCEHYDSTKKQCKLKKCKYPARG